jgi:large subunit ribosomal protein L12
MEYVYAAMLLHSAKKEINETALGAILKSSGVSFDESRVKALVASIKNINIDDAIAKAAVAQVAAGPATSAGPAKAAEPEVDTKKAEEDAAAGLGALFG